MERGEKSRVGKFGAVGPVKLDHESSGSFKYQQSGDPRARYAIIHDSISRVIETITCRSQTILCVEALRTFASGPPCKIFLRWMTYSSQVYMISIHGGTSNPTNATLLPSQNATQLMKTT